jgi:hypothetical protein
LGLRSGDRRRSTANPAAPGHLNTNTGLAQSGQLRQVQISTSEYKVIPIERELRELVGLGPRQRARTLLVEQSLGALLGRYPPILAPSFPWIAKCYPWWSRA